MPDEEHVECALHGRRVQTFVCQHVARSLDTRVPVGFHWPHDSDQEYPDAWCAECMTRFEQCGCEWKGEALELLNEIVLCAECYLAAREIALGSSTISSSMEPNEQEQKALDNIREYGCHVILVSEEGELPPFAYSIGIQEVSNSPEVIVIGLEQDLAHYIVNEYNGRARAGETFTPGERYGRFLDGFDIEFRVVDRSHYRNYFGWGLWHYRGNEFDALQIVYPTTEGVWPWDAAATDAFRMRQPLLS